MLSGFVITWTVDRCAQPRWTSSSAGCRASTRPTGPRSSSPSPSSWLWPLPGTALDLAGHSGQRQHAAGLAPACPTSPASTGAWPIELMFYAYALALFALRPVAPRSFGGLRLVRPGVGQHPARAPSRHRRRSWRLGQLLLIHYAPFLVGGHEPSTSYGAANTRHGPPSPSAVCTARDCAGLLPRHGTGLCLGAMGLHRRVRLRRYRRMNSAHGLACCSGSAPISYPLYLAARVPQLHRHPRTLDGASAYRTRAAMAAALAPLRRLGRDAVSYGVERPALRALRAGWRSRPKHSRQPFAFTKIMKSRERVVFPSCRRC